MLHQNYAVMICGCARIFKMTSKLHPCSTRNLEYRQICIFANKVVIQVEASASQRTELSCLTKLCPRQADVIQVNAAFLAAQGHITLCPCRAKGSQVKSFPPSLLLKGLSLWIQKCAFAIPIQLLPNPCTTVEYHPSQISFFAIQSKFCRGHNPRKQKLRHFFLLAAPENIN